jgi:hypothetical protein
VEGDLDDEVGKEEGKYVVVVMRVVVLRWRKCG